MKRTDGESHLDYVPRTINAMLNEMQGMSQQQLLNILDDDPCQLYGASLVNDLEELPPRVSLSVSSSNLPAHPELLAQPPAHPKVLSPAVEEEMPPYVPSSAPCSNLPVNPEVLTPGVGEELTPYFPLSAPSSHLPAHPEVLAPPVDKEMPPYVPLSAPCSNLPANPEVLALGVGEELPAGFSQSSPISNLPADLPTYAELQARNRMWTTKVENFEEYSFNKEMEPTKSYNHKSLPIEYFSNLFPDELFEMIVKYTNKYAALKQSKFWTDTNVNEIKAFLAIIILMGIGPQSDIELYWSADPFYKT
ncbi:unnamed protein product [Parnassius apollo]|uniref:(apollo) hypothetical protein n=1 Tax=Parnassius apollo TaxID=110799 RepID=A0A8S3X0Z6_PARAO|nr:unnamed protein product [Parnassius apollo]